jgi:hypothetical protein
MLKGISNRSPQHRVMLQRMAMTGMQHLSKMPSAGIFGTEEEFAARYLLNSAFFHGSQGVVLDFSRHVPQQNASHKNV